MKRLLKIKSFTDVITNSSTEVFMIKNDGKYKDILKELKYIDIIYFQNEDDVKNFIHTHMYDMQDSQYFMQSVVKVDPLSEWIFVDLITAMGKSFDEIWDFIKDCYLPLIGYAYVECEDNYCDDNTAYELDILQKLCYNNEDCFMDRR